MPRPSGFRYLTSYPMLTTIILLLASGMILIFVEFFVPGGILGLIGAILMLVGIVLVFNTYGALWGLTTVLGSMIFGFIMIFVSMKVFPNTPIGKHYILAEGIEADSYKVDKAVYSGKEGTAATPLRPSGKALIDGKRVDVVAEGGLVETGEPIRVVRVEGLRVVVRKHSPTPSSNPAPVENEPTA